MSLLSEGSSTGQSTATPTTTTPTGTQPTTTSWKDSLPEDVRSSPALANFKDVGDLVKSYVHAQSMIGKKGVMVPGEKASTEDWDNFYKNIGRPDLDKYDITPPEGVKLDSSKIEGFKKMTHELGLLPKQANALLAKMAETQRVEHESRTKAYEDEKKAKIEGLKKEWGDGYGKQLAQANALIEKFGGEEFAKYLHESPLGDDVNLIKFLANAGKMLGEDSLRGDGTGKFGMTPAEINQEIKELTAQPAYWDKKHGDHPKILRQVEDLYKKLG